MPGRDTTTWQGEPMTIQEKAVADRIIEEVSRSRECLLEGLVQACPGLSWNQVFAVVDRLSRTGQLLLTRKSPGVYSVNLPNKRPLHSSRSPT